MDTAIALWMASLPRIPWLDGFLAFFSSLNDYGLFWILPAIALLIPRSTRRAGAACLLALLFTAVIGNGILKPLIARPRPFVALALPLVIPPPGHYSFPSGHAGSSFAAATVLYLRFPGWPGKLAMALAVLMAFTRVYFTVHYFSDVLAGALLGVLCALAAMGLTRPWGKSTKGV